MTTAIQNRPNGHAWFRFTGANGVIQPNDALANANLESNVAAISITQIFWTGPWAIYRGGNLVFVTDSNYNGHWDLGGHGVALREFNTANIVCNTTSANATLLIQVNKETYANGTAGI